MTLEERARLIADQRAIDDIEAFALRMLREAVDQALKRAGGQWAEARGMDVTKPVRIQLSRKKGFNLQAHSLSVNGLPAVNCARPGPYGNPFDFRKSEYCWLALGYGCKGDRLGRQKASVMAFREWIDPGKGKRTIKYERRFSIEGGGKTFSYGPEIDVGPAPPLEDVKRDLAGRNLACWCKPGEPCHAVVLLELAN